MDMMELALTQKNRFAADYINEQPQALSFFDYAYTDQHAYEKRVAELHERTFPRETLSDYLHTYNQQFSPSQTVLDNIERLKRPDSTVVIGGQQAGVLTGPLYTIHKCISIIRLAKEQEKQLDIPVIPVFWIAGEDHDFAEIDHTYYLKNNNVQKVRVPDNVFEKKTASETELDKTQMHEWVEEIVQSFGETDHTKELLSFLQKTLDDSSTYVAWFSHLLMGLFKEQGLVLIDSGAAQLRSIETPFFEKMIQNNAALNAGVHRQSQNLEDIGFDVPIDIEENSAHLFYHVNGERVLLTRDEEGNFRGKNNECLLSYQEMLDIAEKHPERLSNNVVTRPLMQDHLFPTLAFIGGPGEIAYWSTLKVAFHTLGCCMPPLVPRLNVTLVDRQTEKWLQEHDVSLDEVLTDGLEPKKERWLTSQKQWDIDTEVQRTKNEMDQEHEKMRRLALQIDPHLEDIANKNIQHIFRQLDYFAEKIETSYRAPYERELRKFDRIGAWLLPQQGLQERIWSVMPVINDYGFDWIGQLANHPFVFNGEHKVLFL